MTYCSRCGTENPPGAKFCNGCGAPLDVEHGPVPPQMPSKDSRSGHKRPEEECFGNRPEEECFGQSRVPGIVIFAIVILVIAAIGLTSYIIQEIYDHSIPSEIFWPVIGIVFALLIIILWAASRRRQGL